MSDYQDVNAKVIDEWCNSGWEWGKPVSHKDYLNAIKGNYNVLLTPTKFVPHHWFPAFKGLKILGLASGGGQQMPIFKALGAECTVLDYSQKQLDSELMVAQREGYTIDVIRADMTKKLPFQSNTFDLVFHPVSNCYIKEVKPLFKECYRVLKPGGVLLSGLDNGINYIVDDEEMTIVHKMPFDPTTDEKLYKKCLANDWGIQFSHTLEEQIGGQLEAGFRLTDLYDDTNGLGRLHALNITTYLATRSVKK